MCKVRHTCRVNVSQTEGGSEEMSGRDDESCDIMRHHATPCDRERKRVGSGWRKTCVAEEGRGGGSGSGRQAGVGSGSGRRVGVGSVRGSPYKYLIYKSIISHNQKEVYTGYRNRMIYKIIFSAIGG